MEKLWRIRSTKSTTHFPDAVDQMLFTILDTTFHDVNWLFQYQLLYNFYNFTNQQFVTIPGTSFPDVTDKLLVTSLSNNFMLLQINCLSQFQAQTNYSS